MKINIPRIFEKGELLATDVGQKLTGFLDFVSEFSEQTLRALRNQLTISDNMDAIVSDVLIPDQTETVVYTNGKTPMGIHVLKVSSSSQAVDAFKWYVDENNRTIVWVKYTTIGASSEVKLVIYFN